MSEEYLPHIFEAFSQENASTTSKYGSTGLGLPITKSIVELMNGFRGEPEPPDAQRPRNR